MSKNSKKIRIQIENPVDGCGHTSLSHARRFVKQGRARWAGERLHFITPEEILAASKLSIVDMPEWLKCWRTAEAGILPFSKAA